MIGPAPSSTYWRQNHTLEPGGSPVFERAGYRSSLRNTRVIRPIQSTPASPVMGQSANRIGMSNTSNVVRTQIWNGESRASALPPPAQRNWSAHAANSIRSGPQVTDNLTPIGPPVDKVTTRIDPTTGMLQKVTSRTQSFSDSTKNLYVTETDENIENDQATEYHIKRHTVRKRKLQIAPCFLIEYFFTEPFWYGTRKWKNWVMVNVRLKVSLGLKKSRRDLIFWSNALIDRIAVTKTLKRRLGKYFRIVFPGSDRSRGIWNANYRRAILVVYVNFWIEIK